MKVFLFVNTAHSEHCRPTVFALFKPTPVPLKILISLFDFAEIFKLELNSVKVQETIPVYPIFRLSCDITDMQDMAE